MMGTFVVIVVRNFFLFLCRIIGFDDIGNSDDFQTVVLERRLQSSGKV